MQIVPAVCWNAMWRTALCNGRSQIVSDLIPTQNCTWKPRSVFTILKSLSEKDLIHDVGYVRTGKTYSRKFAPKVSRAEYLAMQVMNELPDQELPEFLTYFNGR